MELDDEIKGEGNSYDFGERMYDPRIGRWFRLDSYKTFYPNQSNYSFALGKPIRTKYPRGTYKEGLGKSKFELVSRDVAEHNRSFCFTDALFMTQLKSGEDPDNAAISHDFNVLIEARDNMVALQDILDNEYAPVDNLSDVQSGDLAAFSRIQEDPIGFGHFSTVKDNEKGTFEEMVFRSKGGFGTLNLNEDVFTQLNWTDEKEVNKNLPANQKRTINEFVKFYRFLGNKTQVDGISGANGQINIFSIQTQEGETKKEAISRVIKENHEKKKFHKPENENPDEKKKG